MVVDKILEDKEFGHLYIKTNARAVRFTFRPAEDGTPQRGVLITVPRGCPLADVLASVERMRPKLRQMLQKPSQSSAAGNNPGKHIDWDFSIQTDSLVVTLVRGSRDGFFLHNEESAWHIEETSGDVVVEKPALMQLICPPDCDFDADGRQDWLEKVIAEGVRSHAKAQLLPRLLALSGLYGFQKNLKEVKINSSKGRWGSCVEHKSPGLLRRSSSFNINLSLFTLLLPLPVQKLILLHELTHIHHMDHSEAFHRELDGMLQGQEQALEKELKHYDTNIFSFV